MGHPLDDAYVQLDGARHDIDVLKNLVLPWQAQDAYDVVRNHDPETGDDVLRVRHRDPPAEFGRQFGRIVGGLRAALDYLIYQLAILDSGSAQEGTQFPIADSPELFEGAVKKGQLKGLSADHINAIEGCQPYNRARWLRQVRELSNPDKHKHLNAVASFRFPGSTTQIVVDHKPYHFPHRLQTWGSQWGISPTPATEMKVEFYVAVRVSLSDGSPVIETLEILETGVRHLMDAFKPDFEGA